MMAAASKGKWVWRFLIRPQVAYAKIGSLPLPEDTTETDQEIVQPRIPTYEVKAIVPKNYMQTGELPRISIQPIKMVDAQISPTTTIAGKPITTLVDMQQAVTKEVVLREFKESDYIKPTPEIRVEQAKKWFTKPTEVKQAVNNYSTNDYEIYNGYLRGTEEIVEFLDDDVIKELNKDIKLMKEVTENELGYDLKLYRNMYSFDDNLIDKDILNSIPKNMQEDFIDYLNIESYMIEDNYTPTRAKLFDDLMGTLKGTTFKDKSFVSTTMSKEKSESTDFGNVQLNIFAPKETKGAIIETLSKAKGEDEVLLNTNTEFEIIGIRKGESLFNLILDVKVVV
jgi:hypothetical protein